MIFLKYKKIIILLQFLTFTFLLLSGQSSGNNIAREKQADSLSAAGNHKEAAEILISIIDDRNSRLKPDDRMRLEYKTGYNLMHSGEDIKAMPFFREVITANTENGDKVLLNDAMTGLGRTYEYTGKYDSAFYWYLESFKQVRESNDTLRRARGARNMAQLLRVLKRFDEARKYCREALYLLPGINDYKVVANIYNETAYLFELSDDLDSAAYYYKRLIDLSVANGYLKGESVGYSNLASVYEKQKKFSQALEYKMKGIDIDKVSGDNYGLMVSNRGLSSTYLLAASYDNALDALNRASELCDTSWLPDLAGIKLGYYEIYKAKRQYGKALDYYEEYISLDNRINKRESQKQVAGLLARFETEKKEQQIKILEQANLLKEERIHLQWLIIGIMTLLGLFIVSTSWLWIRNKNQKLKQINSELQHFLIRQEKMESKTEQEELTLDPGEMYKKWGLTSRESEILYYLGRGYSNSQIGEELFISANTVKFHIKNIYLKLDVKTRIQALLRCSDNQIITT